MINIENYFSAPIGYVINPKHNSIKENLCKLVNETKEQVASGGKGWVSNQTYNTSDNQFDICKDKRFDVLNNWVRQQVEDYKRLIKQNLTIDDGTGWFNVYTKGDYQEQHQHIGSFISCVYFLKARQDGASIYFRPPYYDTHTNQSSIKHKAEEGKLLMFRSFIPHGVGKHDSDEDRITLAYNFDEINTTHIR